MRIKQYISEGEICGAEADNTQLLYEAAGQLLDDSCSHDICGEVMFLGEDRRFYKGTVEFVICECSPTEVVEALSTGEFSQCCSCGKINNEQELKPVDFSDDKIDAGNHDVAGICPSCNSFSYTIFRDDAIKLAGVAQSKPSGLK